MDIRSLRSLTLPRLGETKDMKPGVNYFADLPDTFETVTGYVARGADMVFTPDQLNAVSSENN